MTALAAAARITASATGPTGRPRGASATQPVAASAHNPMPVRLAVNATVVTSSHAASAPGAASARRRSVAAHSAAGSAPAQTRASAGGYSNGPDGRQLPQRSSASGSEVAMVAARPLIALPTAATSSTPACAHGAGTDAAATTTAHSARIAAASRAASLGAPVVHAAVSAVTTASAARVRTMGWRAARPAASGAAATAASAARPASAATTPRASSV